MMNILCGLLFTITLIVLICNVYSTYLGYIDNKYTLFEYFIGVVNVFVFVALMIFGGWQLYENNAAAKNRRDLLWTTNQLYKDDLLWTTNQQYKDDLEGTTNQQYEDDGDSVSVGEFNYYEPEKSSFAYQILDNSKNEHNYDNINNKHYHKKIPEIIVTDKSTLGTFDSRPTTNKKVDYQILDNRNNENTYAKLYNKHHRQIPKIIVTDESTFDSRPTINKTVDYQTSNATKYRSDLPSINEIYEDGAYYSFNDDNQDKIGDVGNIYEAIPDTPQLNNHYISEARVDEDGYEIIDEGNTENYYDTHLLYPKYSYHTNTDNEEPVYSEPVGVSA